MSHSHLRLAWLFAAIAITTMFVLPTTASADDPAPTLAFAYVPTTPTVVRAGAPTPGTIDLSATNAGQRDADLVISVPKSVLQVPAGVTAMVIGAEPATLGCSASDDGSTVTYVCELRPVDDWYFALFTIPLTTVDPQAGDLSSSVDVELRRPHDPSDTTGRFTVPVDVQGRPRVSFEGGYAAALGRSYDGAPATTVFVGEAIQYRFDLVNTAPDIVARYLRVRFEFPGDVRSSYAISAGPSTSGLSFDVSNCEPLYYSSTEDVTWRTCSLSGALGIGERQQLRLDVDPDGATGPFEVKYWLGSTYFDVVDASTLSTALRPVDLAISDVTSPSPVTVPTAGTTAAFRATVRNAGTTSTPSAGVFVTLPKQITAVAAAADGAAVPCTIVDQSGGHDVPSRTWACVGGSLAAGATRPFTISAAVTPGHGADGYALTLPASFDVVVSAGLSLDDIAYADRDSTNNTAPKLALHLIAAPIADTPPATCAAGLVGTPPSCRERTPIERLAADIARRFERLLGGASIQFVALPLFGAATTAVQPSANRAGVIVTRAGAAPFGALRCARACTITTTFVSTFRAQAPKQARAQRTTTKTLRLRTQRLQVTAGAPAILQATFTKAQLKQLRAGSAPKLTAVVTYQSGKVRKVKRLTYGLRLR